MNYPTAPSPAFLTGGGETGQLIRSIDWSKTSMGPSESWSPSLKVALQIMFNSRFPMFIWWGKQLIYFYNDAYLPTLGIRHPAALGKPATEIWSEIWEDLRPQVEAVMERGEASWNEELLLFLERSGFPEETYHTFSYSPISDDAGVGSGLYCAVMEVTAQVISRRRLQTLRDLSERSLMEAKNVPEVCRAAAKTLAETSKDIPFALLYLLEEDGKTARFAESVLPNLYNNILPAEIEIGSVADIWHFKQVLETNRLQIVNDIETKIGPIQVADWTDVWTEKAVVLPLEKAGVQEFLAGFLVAGISPRQLFDNDYQSFIELVAGHVASAIANAHAMEEERKRAEALAEIDRAKTTFFSNVSHEFRTPLTLLLGPLEDVLNNATLNLPLEQKENLDISHRNALRLLKLVNTLLDFSRIESNRIQASYEPLNLCELTKDLASNFRSAIEKAGMKLIVKVDDLSEPVYVDREMWEKIVLNLLSNAFKYTLVGSIEVQLKEENRHAVLSVKDTGVGIPESEIDNIFKRFHRVQNVQGRTHEGTGIGLSLVQELVNLHGGAIRVHSTQGEGSTFIVRIPLGKSHLLAAQIQTQKKATSNFDTAIPFVEEALRWLPEVPETPKLPNAQTSDLNGKRPYVLLADDNADMRDYVQKLLNPYFIVETAKDGIEALEIIQRQTPDLVLSDIMMPRMDGIELLKHLKENPQTALTPVIFLSARAGEEAQIDGLASGADDYLIKPFSARELLTRVQSHLKIAAIRSESEQRIRNMVLQTPYSIVILKGANFVYEIVNDAYLKLSQKTHDEVIGKPLFEVFPEIEHQGMRELLEKIIATGEAISFNEQPLELNRAGETETVYYNSIYQPLREVDGNISGVMLMGVEVTEQVLTRKKAEESERRLQNMISQAPVGIAILRGATYIFDIVNADYLPLVDKTYEELLGKPLLEVLPELVTQPIKALLDEVVATGEPFSGSEFSVVINRKGKIETVYFNFVYQPLREIDGSIERVMVVATDVSEQVTIRKRIEQSEERLQIATQAAQLGVWEYDIQQDTALWHGQRMHEIFGFDPIDTPLNKNTILQEFIHPDDVETLNKDLETAFTTGKPLHSIYRSRRKNTEGWIWLEQNARVEYDASNIPIRMVGVTADITERKEAEEALLAGKNRLQTMMDAAKMYAWEINPATNQLHNSANFARIVGFELPEDVTKAVDYLHEADLAETSRKLTEAIEKYTPFEHEFRLVNPLTGEAVWLTGQAVMTYNTTDGQPRLSGISQNITDRKVAEEARSASEAQLRAIYDGTSEYIGLLTPDGILLQANRASLEFANSKLEDVIGLPFWEAAWFKYTPGAPEFVQQAIAQAAAGEFVRFESPIITPSGETMTFDISLYPIRNEAGEVILIVPEGRDLTERKRLEQEREHFLEVGSDLQVIFGFDGRFKWMNAIWEQTLGWTTDELIEQPWLHFMHPDDQAASIQEAEKISKGSIAIDFENRYRHKDGSYRWLRWQAKPQLEENVMYAVATDITERKTAEEARRVSEERYRTLFEAMDEGFCVIEVLFDKKDRPIDYRFLEINPTFERQTGLQNAVGKTALELVPNLEKHWIETYGNVALTGEPARFLNGSEAMGRWFDVYTYRIGKPGSRKVGILFKDISERKASEQEIKQLSERTRDILESITDAFFALDQDWRFTYVNPQAELLLDRSPGDLLGNTIWEEYPGTVGSEFEKAYLQAAHERIASTFTAFYPSHNRWYEVHAYPAMNGITAYFQNVTERKEAENNLRQQKRLLEALTESVLDGILMVSPEGKMLHFNQQFLNIWNFPPEIVEAKSDELALQYAANETTDPAAFLARVTDIYSQPDQQYREEMWMKNGRVYERFGAAIQDGDTRLGWVWTFRDITERKQAEATLRQVNTLVELSYEPIFIWEVKNGIIEWNAGAEQTYGFTRSEALGRNSHALLQTIHQLPMDNFIKVLEQNGFWTGEIQHTTKDGRQILIESRHQLIETNGRRLVLETNRDITKRKAAEAALQQSAQRLTIATDAAKLGVYEWDIPNDITYWENERMYEIVGLSPENGTPSSQTFIQNHLHPADEAYFEAQFAKALQGELLYALVRVKHLTEGWRWVEYVGQVEVTPDSTPLKLVGVVADVTERKAAEEKLRFLVALNQALLPLTEPDEIMSVTARMLGEHLQVSRCAYAEVEADENHFRLTGDYTRDTFSIVGNFAFSSFGEEVMRLMRANEPYIVTDIKTDPRAQGHLETYYQTDITAVICLPLHKNGRFTAAMAVHQKVPRNWTNEEVELVQLVVNRCWEALERAQVLGNLRENEARLRIAIDSTELGTFDWNLLTDELNWDDRTRELFGLSPNAFVDINVFYKGLHPDDWASTEQAVSYALQPESNGEYEVEYRTIGLEDQKLRWVRAKGKVFFNVAGKAIRFIGSVLDITKAKLYETNLKESEALFRKLADDVPIKIWMTRPDGYCTYLNKQWFNYTGQTKEAAAGFGWLTVVHPEDAKNFEEVFFNANQKHIHFSLEYRLKGKDGTYRWKVEAGEPRFDENGEFEGFIGAVVDIHERKRAEEQKDAFMRIAGHELRTPLTSLVGYLSLMLKAPDNTAMVMNFAKKSYEGALKMRSLISDFLDFSKALQGELSFEISEFDFDTLVTDAIDNMQFSYPQHRIFLQGQTDKRMQGDYGRMEQVLNNLLHNAIKYSPGKDRVDVSLQANEDKIILQIKDYGVGIEAKDVNKIFHKFHRADNIGKIKGMGLGLYIVKEIVDFHKGKIWVESTPGEGALFIVEFPALT